MSTQSLDLKLSDEEKKDIAIRVIDEHWKLLDKKLEEFTPSISALGSAIADAATARAAWTLHSWLESGWASMGSQDTYIHLMEQYSEFLEAQGIQKPE